MWKTGKEGRPFQGLMVMDGWPQMYSSMKESLTKKITFIKISILGVFTWGRCITNAFKIVLQQIYGKYSIDNNATINKRSGEE